MAEITAEESQMQRETDGLSLHTLLRAEMVWNKLWEPF
jgi:hypothetical protein